MHCAGVFKIKTWSGVTSISHQFYLQIRLLPSTLRKDLDIDSHRIPKSVLNMYEVATFSS